VSKATKGLTPRQHAKKLGLPYAMIKLDKRTASNPDGMIVFEGPVGESETEFIEELLIVLAKTFSERPS
jgi:hypothetical protein